MTRLADIVALSRYKPRYTPEDHNSATLSDPTLTIHLSTAPLDLTMRLSTFTAIASSVALVLAAEQPAPDYKRSNDDKVNGELSFHPVIRFELVQTRRQM
jgi:hypothetical protein